MTVDYLPENHGLSIAMKGHRPLADDGSIQLTIAAASVASISITWSPQQAGTLQDFLYCQWDKERLKVLLYGTTPALPVSSLMHASVKRALTDTSGTEGGQKPLLPQTLAGQKVVKSQRVGGISPGHPTFEAAMRSVTAATPGRGAATPGLSRYANKAASQKAQSPALTFAARLQDVADSPPKPAVADRPKLRMKQASGRAPMRTLKLSTDHSAAVQVVTGKVTKSVLSVPSVQQLAANRNQENRLPDRSKASRQGFSYFHSRCIFLSEWLQTPVNSMTPP